MGFIEKSVIKNLLDDGRFQVRESPLKDAFDKHSAVRGTFSAVVTIFGLVFVVMTAVYVAAPEVFLGDLAFVQRSFGNFSSFAMQWIILHSALFLIAFPATKHHVMNKDSNYFNYQIFIFFTVAVISVVPVYTIFTFKLHPVLSLAIVMEQIRILMKLIAYLVENRKKKRYFEETDDVEVQPPAFSSFVYFMFAPTLVYRDRYPSSKPTDWKLVASYAAQVLACIFMGMILLRHQLQPRFNVIGTRALTVEDITGIFLWSIAFAWFIALAIGYTFLHAWQNMFAEMLQFGDRLFYKDWFSAVDAMDFMRTWNYLIHSWIVEYLYKPVLRSTGSKPFAIFTVMAMAGLVHDYVINMTNKYFLLYETTFIPIMLFTTCWTQWMQPAVKGEEKEKVVKMEKKEVVTNIAMFVIIVVTNMMECMVLTAEVYAVRNCERPENSWKSNFLVPQFLSCPLFEF